jgi:hypothetical protein
MGLHATIYIFTQKHAPAAPIPAFNSGPVRGYWPGALKVKLGGGQAYDYSSD